MFIDDTFLLQSDLAITLYQDIKDLPIIDYHNHLSPREIFKNEPYTDITDLWLAHDHYKWRLMRASGIDEHYITGDASNKEKFMMFAKALEMAYLNPLYHWSHMELKVYFGITEVVTTDNAEDMYNQANRYLHENQIGPRELLEMRHVEALCTTDDLNDDLEFHRLIKDDDCSFRVLPTFRPDSLFRFNDDSFFDVITLLEKNTSTTITGITTLALALSKRLDFFQANGCVTADHGFTTLNDVPVTKKEASAILKKRLMHGVLTATEVDQLTIYLLMFFIKEYGLRGIVCQLHIGALRNTNERMFQKLGRDAGYDSISDYDYINDLNQLLSKISHHFELPKMIIYNLHPKDNEALASLCANFSSDYPGKIQLGAAWWFNDTYRGILRQIEAFSEYLNLSTMVGMLTDSRSFLSFVRHDYYRRILANYIATKVEEGQIPNNRDQMVNMLRKISYDNSEHYFNL
jgi:glucuronate isomerase